MKNICFKLLYFSIIFLTISVLHAQKQKVPSPKIDTVQSDSAVKEFLLSAYNPPYAWREGPYNDTDFTYYKNANFNNFMWVRDEEGLMNKVHQYNFKFFVNIRELFSEDSNGVDYLTGVKYWDDGSETYNEPVSAVTEEMLQEVDAVVEKYKNDPDLIGYWICDEPFPTAYGNISKVIQRIKDKDPLHYSLVNIGDNEYTTDDNIEHFIDTTKVEVLCYDRYNFFNGFDLNDDYFDLLGRMRNHALTHNIHFYNTVQAVGTNGTSAGELDWRTPNKAEHRWLAYTSLAYGVHGLIWFHWDAEDWGVVQNPDKDIIYPSLQSINAEIDSLIKIMFRLTTTRVFHIKGNNYAGNDIVKSVSDNVDMVLGVFKDENEKENYFMLMNADYTDSLSAQITLNFEVDELKVFDVENDTWENVPFENTGDGAVYTIKLRSGSGKLYRFVKKDTTGLIKLRKVRGKFSLGQNYPNPFNPATTIKYSIPEAGFVSLKVYDILGNEVAVLVNGNQSPGTHEINFNANNLANGIYFYKLKYGNNIQVKRMILMK